MYSRDLTPEDLSNFQQSITCEGCLQRKTILKDGKKPLVSIPSYKILTMLSYRKEMYKINSTSACNFCILHVDKNYDRRVLFHDYLNFLFYC